MFKKLSLENYQNQFEELCDLVKMSLILQDATIIVMNKYVTRGKDKQNKNVKNTSLI